MTGRMTALLLAMMLLLFTAPVSGEKASAADRAYGIVTFGRYEQDGEQADGAEEIEWLVLEVREDRALLLSRYALAARKYNETNTAVTWETCTLRAWLNGEFASAAFTPQEAEAILVTDVDNSSRQGNKDKTDGGPDTQDRLFLLSGAEAEQYLSMDDDWTCLPTSAAQAEGALKEAGTGKCSWWLRSPGIWQTSAMCASRSGSQSVGVNNSWHCVRPAMWVRLDAGYFGDIGKTARASAAKDAEEKDNTRLVCIVIYVILCAACAIVAWNGAKKDSAAGMKAFAVMAVIAGLVMAFGVYDPAQNSGGKLYVSGAGGTGGMSFNSIMMAILFMVPPVIAAAIAVGIASKKR